MFANVLLLCGCSTLLKLVRMNVESCLSVSFSNRSTEHKISERNWFPSTLCFQNLQIIMNLQKVTNEVLFTFKNYKKKIKKWPEKLYFLKFYLANRRKDDVRIFFSSFSFTNISNKAVSKNSTY